MRAFSLAPGFRSGLIVSFAFAVGCAMTSVCRESAAEEAVASSIKSAPATHKQKQIVKVAKSTEGQKLEDFCIDSQGRILALLGPIGADNEQVIESDDSSSGTSVARRLPRGKKPKPPKFESAIHVYDSDGKLTEQWPVGFPGQAINTAPDGTIVVGGNGRVARFDAEGKKLLEAESPQMTYINKSADEMRERAKEQLESDRARFAENIKQFEEQLKEVQNADKDGDENKKPAKSKKGDEDTEDDPDNQRNEQQLKSYVNSYKNHLQMLERKTVEQSLAEVTARAKKIHAITAGKEDIFVTCPAMAGYGYGVWRTDLKFENAKEIVKSLSGCCGQMDVQCQNGELYVCENSRHRVIRFDRDGKQIAQFGKKSREGEGEKFGGCCNPMNLCFSKDGNLYVSESNGVVKHFTPAGKFLGIVGVAQVQPGCKNSCVGVTADDSRLFYIDVQKSQIIILARNDAADK